MGSILRRAASREAWGQRALPVALKQQQLIAAAAMRSGNATACVRAARAAAAATSLGLLLHGRGVEAVLAGPALALARFGRWRELEAEEPPSPLWPLAVGLDRYARGLAAIWAGDADAAHEHHAGLAAAQRNLPDGAIAGENDARVVIGMARRVLGGEIFLATGEVEEGLAMLRAAVGVEDSLRANEPGDWPWPVRHQLGAALLDAGRPEEAQSVFVADLALNPENGWALFGLAQALVALGLDDRDVRARFRAAWSTADTRLRTARHAG
ncbi:MAG: tetratricopeptide repeat protein [Myxococcota bacterium]